MNRHAVSPLIVALSLLAGSASLAQDELPDTARLMTAYELLTLYGGKSWEWENGAAFMKEEGRQLVAWYGEAESFGYTRGRWTVTDTGRFCLVAKWITREDTYPKRTCFEHRVDGGTIYQRSLPEGSWYIFKHNLTETEDEYNKIVPEDLASSIVGDRP
jgi:hypothetical protein